MQTNKYNRILIKSAKLKKYEDGSPCIFIKFPFDFDTLQQVKSLPNRIYHPEIKAWTCHLTLDNIQTLRMWGFEIDEELKGYELYQKQEYIEQKIDLEIDGFGLDLFNYQKVGVRLIDKYNGRALLADEMGLGKTAQALAWCQMRNDKKPIIVVCPASLKYNWAYYAKLWMTGIKVEVINGKNLYKTQGNFIIINYDIIGAWKDELIKINPQVLILDECHYIKNDSAARTKGIKRLAKNIPHIIPISGTPITNKPIEIFNSIHLINPKLFPKKWDFAKRYCDLKHDGFGWNFDGSSNIEELHEILINSIMIRRKKQDVLKDLPDKLFNWVPVEINNWKEYNRALYDFENHLRNKINFDENKTVTILQQIEELKQLAVKGKLNECIEWINNFLTSGKKLVIFGVHKFFIEKLMENFGSVAVKIDGSVANNKRQVVINDFQNNPEIKLFIGNIKAAGVGLTLTAASDVLIGEFPWTPAELDQAIDRIHRIGQKETANVHYFVARNTIEEDIAKRLDEKMKIVSKLLDGEEIEKESLLSELIKKYS